MPTDNLTNPPTYNPTSHKATTIKTLARRAQLVCDTLDSVRDENKYLNTRLTEHKRTTRNDEANNHTSHLTMKMTSASAQFVETSVTNGSFFFQNYPHVYDHTIRTTDTPGLKPFTMSRSFCLNSKARFQSIKYRRRIRSISHTASLH